jgi:hypothetical protein
VSPSRPKSRTQRPNRTGSSAGAGPAEPVPAPADKLKREVQAALTEDLDAGQGFAYVGAEAYFHLAGGYETGLHPAHLKHRGKSHWWLVDSDGRVIDLTVGPRETSDFPYGRGRRRPFRHTPAGISRRAQTIVERVRAARV